MVCWGVEFLSHAPVTHIFCTVGMSHFNIIVITIMIICTYEFVDLGMVTIFWLEVDSWMIHVIARYSCVCPKAPRNQVYWIGCHGCPGNIVLHARQRVAPGKRCAFALVIDEL